MCETSEFELKVEWFCSVDWSWTLVRGEVRLCVARLHPVGSTSVIFSTYWDNSCVHVRMVSLNWQPPSRVHKCVVT